MTTTPLQDRITPFFFGPTDRQLFGLYHTPNPEAEREFGVLICNPWGQEYVRAHRALGQMGLRLARQGFPVLRFDYFATGDSSGDDQEGTLAQWQNDIRAAIQELKRRARVDSVFLVGLRLGATLATLVASGRDDVEGLVLWEPAVRGVDYLTELQDWNADKEMYFLTKPTHSNDDPELLGFQLNPNLLLELQSLDLLATRRKPAARVTIIENVLSAERARPEVSALRDHFSALGAETEYALVESFILWTENPDKGLVPQQVLEIALNWLTREAG